MGVYLHDQHNRNSLKMMRNVCLPKALSLRIKAT